MSSPEDHEHSEEEEQGAYYNVPDPVLRVARRLYGQLTQSGEVVREEGFVARSSLLKHLNQLGVKISKEELDAAIASQNVEEEEPGGRVDIEEFQQRCVPLLCELEKNVSEPDSPSPHPASPLVQTPAQMDANPELRTLAQLMSAVGIEGAHENSPEVAAVARALRDLTSPKNRSPFRPLPPRLAQVLNGHSESEHVIEDHVTEHSDHVLESDSEHDVNALKDKLKRVKEENHVLALKVNMLESRLGQQEQQHDEAMKQQREQSEEIERLKKVTKHKQELEDEKHVLIEQLEALKAEQLGSSEAIKELKRKETEWSAEKDDMRNDIFTKMKELNDMQDELTQLRQHADKNQELTQYSQSQLKVRRTRAVYLVVRILTAHVTVIGARAATRDRPLDARARRTRPQTECAER
jgi:DNA repair exonuclease SbcCD ATPase subunit